MKLKSIFLVIVALLVTALLPMVNLIHGDISKASLVTVKRLIDAAYKTDHLTGWLNLARTKFGYSSDPAQAIIGKEGWMYLGDRHAKSISVNRGLLLPPEKNFQIAKNRRLSIRDYAKDAGALGTYFIIAPNKERIYPENLPDWAKSDGKPTFSTRLLRENDVTLINLFPAMVSAKAKHQSQIYLKTDSHWNDIGAWEAYKYISKKISEENRDIRFLSDADVSIDASTHGRGGDISSFLFIAPYLNESRPTVKLVSDPAIKIVSATSGKAIYNGANKLIYSQSSPIAVTSSESLNSMRVLWLRDSFGNLLAPFFAATFSETIQLHWSKALSSNAAITSLIDTYKPDLVLFTIVERSYFEVIHNAHKLPVK